MDAPCEDFSVLACLTLDEVRSETAMSEAVCLARELNAPLTVVQLYPPGWRGPFKPHSSAWHLKSEDPVSALRRFVARNRITHIVA